MFHGYQNLVGFFHLAILLKPPFQPPHPPQLISNGTHASAHNLDGRPRKMLAVLNLLWTLRYLHGRVLFVFFFFSLLLTFWYHLSVRKFQDAIVCHAIAISRHQIRWCGSWRFWNYILENHTKKTRSPHDMLCCIIQYRFGRSICRTRTFV